MSRSRSYCFSSLVVFISVTLFFTFAGPVRAEVRTEVKIPNIPEYTILKCDFHTHTVFSDGDVWPTVRVEEAWRDGLDAIAITDHIEYQPHKKDVSTDRNRSYELAETQAQALGVILIRGAEITRSLPPGHFNAIFIKDANPLDTKEYLDAIKAAIDQGAFVFWNHPSFSHPKGISEWFPEHTTILEKGWMYGIEVVNGRTYYPESQQWCREKKLTMMGDSDIHDPIGMYSIPGVEEKRPMTLVLAKERSPEAIKEALFARRTVVYALGMLIGEEQYLKPIFDASINVLNPSVNLSAGGRGICQIRNNSEVSFDLECAAQPEDITVPQNLVLYGDKVTRFQIKAKSKETTGTKKVKVSYVVKNLLIAPKTGLPVTLELEAVFAK